MYDPDPAQPHPLRWLHEVTAAPLSKEDTLRALLIEAMEHIQNYSDSEIIAMRLVEKIKAAL